MISIPEFFTGFGVGAITMSMLILVFPHHPAMTCDDIDMILTKNLLGQIELDQESHNIMMDTMDWCIEKGFEVKPLTQNEIDRFKEKMAINE